MASYQALEMQPSSSKQPHARLSQACGLCVGFPERDCAFWQQL